MHLLVERILLAQRCLGRLHAREIAVLRKLNAPFDLSHRVQVAVEKHFIARTQVQLQRPGTLGDEIKDAPLLLDDGHALFRCRAFTEQLCENFARVGLHRQRRVCIPVRQRGAVEAAESSLARDRLDVTLRADLHRRQRRLLTDAAGNDLVDRRRHAGTGRFEIGLDTAEPGRRVVFVHGGDAGLVLEMAERRHEVLVLLERLENVAELEIRAGAARGPAIPVLPMGRVPHDRAMGHIEEARPQLRRGGGLRERGGGRDHRIEQRQSDGTRPRP